MARRKKGRSRKMKAIPIAPLLPAGWLVINDWRTTGGQITPFTSELCAHTTGYHPGLKEWKFAYGAPFWGAMVAGIVVHKVANKVGVNKYIRKGTMGFLQL